MRLDLLALLTLLAACGTSDDDARSDTDPSETDAGVDTDRAEDTDDTDAGDTDAADTDANVTVLEEDFEDPALTADGSVGSPSIPGWAAMPAEYFWGYATLWRAQGNQFLDLKVACDGCTGTQSLSDGLVSVRTLPLDVAALAGKRCAVAAGIFGAPPALYDSSFQVRVRLLHGDDTVAASIESIPTSGTNRVGYGDLPATITEDVVVEVALEQTAALPAGSATATGARIYVDNVAVVCAR